MVFQAPKDRPDYNPNHSSVETHISSPSIKYYSKRSNLMFKAATVASDRYFPHEKWYNT